MNGRIPPGKRSSSEAKRALRFSAPFGQRARGEKDLAAASGAARGGAARGNAGGLKSVTEITSQTRLRGGRVPGRNPAGKSEETTPDVSE